MSNWSPDMLALVSASLWQLGREGLPVRAQDADVARERIRAAPNLWTTACRHKMPGTLRNAVAGLLPGSEIDHEMRSLSKAIQIGYLRGVATAAKVQECLRGEGCQPLLIKGLALAAQSAQEFWARGNGDVDILVAPSELPTAVKALTAAGAEITSGHPALKTTNATPHGFLHAVTCSLDGVHVDVHSRLDEIPSVLAISHRELWDRRATVSALGIQFDTLDPIDATLLVCAHAGRNSWGHLGSILDLVRLLYGTDVGGRREQLAMRAISSGTQTRFLLGIRMMSPFIQPKTDTKLLVLLLANGYWIRLAAGVPLLGSDRPQDVLTSNISRALSADSLEGVTWLLDKLWAVSVEAHRVHSNQRQSGLQWFGARRGLVQRLRERD